MSRYKNLICNTLILGVGKFASKVIVFFLMPLYTAILSPDAFGVADLISQTANLLIPLACVGVCDGLFRCAMDTDKRKNVFSAALMVQLVGAVVLAAALPLLNLWDMFDGYVVLIGFYVICANFHSACAEYVRAAGKTALFAAQGILNTVLTVLLNLLFLLVFKMGVTGYVLSVVVADAIVGLLLFFGAGLYRDFSVRHIRKDCLSDLLRFSIPYIPTTLLWMAVSVSDRYVVSIFCGEAATGLYAAAYKIPTLLTLICGVFIDAWQFSAVKDATEEERASFFGKVFRAYGSILFMGGAVLILGAPIFTRMLMAESYYESWRFIPILVLATLFSALVSFLGSVYFVEKKSVFSMLTALSGAVVNLVLNFLLIPDHGPMGAAIATMISYMAVFLIRAYDTKRYVRFRMYPLRTLLGVGLLLLMTAVMLLQMAYWMWIALGIAVLMLVIYGKELVMSALMLAKRIFRKKV